MHHQKLPPVEQRPQRIVEPLAAIPFVSIPNIPFVVLDLVDAQLDPGDRAEQAEQAPHGEALPAAAAGAEEQLGVELHGADKAQAQPQPQRQEGYKSQENNDTIE